MKDTFDQLEKLTGAVSDPEYRFLLLEPILLFGIAIGLIGFIVSYFLKAEKLQIVALIAIIASALVFIPYTKARTSAQPRIEKIYKIQSPSRARSFVENTALWKKADWIYFAVAGLAIATILVGARRNRLGLTLGILTISVGLLAMKNSAWMHYKDALAYHPNLKSNDDAPVKEKLRAKPVADSKPAPGPDASGIATRIDSPTPPSTSPAPRKVTPIN